MKLKTKKILSVLLALVMMQSLALCAISASAASKVYVPDKIGTPDSSASRMMSYDTKNKTLTIKNTENTYNPIQPPYHFLYLNAKDSNAIILNVFAMVPAEAMSQMVKSGKITKIILKEGEYTKSKKWLTGSIETTTFTRDSNGNVTKMSMIRKSASGNKTEATRTVTLQYTNNLLSYCSSSYKNEYNSLSYKVFCFYNSNKKLSRFLVMNGGGSNGYSSSSASVTPYTVNYNSKGYVSSITEISGGKSYTNKIKTTSKGAVTAVGWYELTSDANGNITKAFEEDIWITCTATYKAI